MSAFLFQGNFETSGIKVKAEEKICSSALFLVIMFFHFAANICGKLLNATCFFEIIAVAEVIIDGLNFSPYFFY